MEGLLWSGFIQNTRVRLIGVRRNARSKRLVYGFDTRTQGLLTTGLLRCNEPHSPIKVAVDDQPFQLRNLVAVGS